MAQKWRAEVLHTQPMREWSDLIPDENVISDDVEFFFADDFDDISKMSEEFDVD